MKLIWILIGGFNRSFPFRLTYEKVLSQVEHADEEAKKTKRLPRSYEESDKKLKTVKIVTKKGDATADENKKKKSKQMAASNKSSGSAVENEEEIQEEEVENLDEQKNIEETQEEPAIDQDENERVPLEEVQQTTMSVAEKLQAIGKKPAPFSKAAAKYEKDSMDFLFMDFDFFIAKLHRNRKRVNQKRFKLHQISIKWIRMALIIRKKPIQEK